MTDSNCFVVVAGFGDGDISDEMFGCAEPPECGDFVAPEVLETSLFALIEAVFAIRCDTVVGGTEVRVCPVSSAARMQFVAPGVTGEEVGEKGNELLLCMLSNTMLFQGPCNPKS